MEDEFVPKYNKNGYEIKRDYCTHEDVFKENKAYCPECKTDDIIILKGDGEYINGIDEIALMCNKCKKVYEFNDVKYKSNCPKQL